MNKYDRLVLIITYPFERLWILEFVILSMIHCLDHARCAEQVRKDAEVRLSGLSTLTCWMIPTFHCTPSTEPFVKAPILINIVGALSSAFSPTLSPCCHSPNLLSGALFLKVQVWCCKRTSQLFAARKSIPASVLASVLC